MRRITLVSATALAAVALVLASPSLAQEGSRAAAEPSDLGPSQGSFTEGRAGPNEASLVDGFGPGSPGGDGATARSRASGNAVVRAARRHVGTKYRYATCTSARMSCTCLTKKAAAAIGARLPMTEGGQWRYEPSRRIAKSNLRPGDMVFFKEAGPSRPITHVGVYSGKGNLVHASSYFGKVVESKMKYIRGYYGAKRLRAR